MLSDRQTEILALIKADGAQSVEDLARRYGLTTQTLRRDINQLCDLGLARRFHGGVDVPVEGRNISASARFALNSRAKQAIARRIAADIPEGATVLMGIGSSVQYVAEALREHRDLTVATNNVDVALTLGDAKNCEIHLSGGIYRPDDREMVGIDVLRFFARFHATCAVMGAGGLHVEAGLLEFSHDDAEVSRAIVENTQLCLLAADASKWNRPAVVRAVPFERIDRFYTDRLPADPRIDGMLQGAGVMTVICGAEEP